MKMLLLLVLLGLATTAASAQTDLDEVRLHNLQEHDHQQNAAFDKMMRDNLAAPKIDPESRIHRPPTPLFFVSTSSNKSSPEVCLQIREPDLLATVHYTTDGKQPDKTSKTYTGPFCIPHHTRVRAIAIPMRNRPPSEMIARTFR